MTHPSIAHSGASAHASNVHGSHAHNQHVAAVSLNRGENVHDVHSTTSINQQDPEFIFVKQTCPTDCSGTKCGQRHEHSNTRHGAHPTHRRTSEDERPSTDHGAQPAPHHLTAERRKALRESLFKLLELLGWTESTSLDLTFLKLTIVDVIDSAAAQEDLKAILARASGLPERLFEIARPLPLDEVKVQEYAECALSTLKSLQHGKPVWLENCVEISTSVERPRNPEMVFTLLCLGHNIGQPKSTLLEFAEKVSRALELSPGHHGSHHHGSAEGHPSTVVCASSLCLTHPDRGSAFA